MSIIGLALAAAGAAPPLAQPALAPFGPLVGHCWRGEVLGTGTDTHCFDFVYGGQHIRDRHSVSQGGKTVYEGETLYSASKSGIAFTYWNSLGGFGTGTADVAGSNLTFSGTIHATPSSGDEPMAVTWRLRPAAYDVVDAGGSVREFRRTD